MPPADGSHTANRHATSDLPALSIRAATGDDHSFVRQLSGQVFSQFGDYATFLTAYLDEPAIETLVAERDGAPAGFLMMAAVQDAPPEPYTDPAPAERTLIAEILAIAVLPAYHREGIGRRLLQRALELIEPSAAAARLRSLQLNVAHTNARALAFFSDMGFSVLKEDDGSYPAGQRSIRMVRPLDGGVQSATPAGPGRG